MLENIKDYIKIDQCKPGYVYRIHARNGNFGIYKTTKAEQFKHNFLLSRHKFNLNYIFPEHHWDDGEPYGTAKPMVEIGPVPKDILDDETKMLAYLNGLDEAEKKGELNFGYRIELVKFIYDFEKLDRRWIEDDEIKIYVRKGQRYVGKEKGVKCLEIANVESAKKGIGTFTRFLEFAEALNRLPMIFIENVMEERFADFFRKRGYSQYELCKEPPSFYKITSPSE